VTQQPNGGGISAKCLHASCEGFDWSAYRELREPGYKSPRNNGAAQKEREEPDSDYDTVAFSPEFSEDALGLRFTYVTRPAWATGIAGRANNGSKMAHLKCSTWQERYAETPPLTAPMVA